ncbi:ABC transporter ATP-binding protein [Nocardioides sp.]|uniref:ABC transporter ATP-binding protein n=1 Tax=Nocardioides sp. TaxID=35761 RepID=UPI0019C00B73|nr:ABC transporter ATP-binding protein [Nocardioides sp.]MBC7278066.1 ABC transporter ATP-binding protein [Nocardioides sp.]
MNQKNAQAPAKASQADFDLEIKGLVASYGSSVAVNELNLTIGRSEFVTLLGPSGCGKTTTLRCVAGLHTPSGGDIELAGRRVFGGGTNVPPNKRDINMVFQSYAVWPHMTTLENVMYGLKAKKMDGRLARQKAGDMLDLVGLEAFADRYATDLSGGQQQRVALARALATEPSLVLMDEPLSNLDAQLRARMRDEIRQIQKSTSTSVLYVTHDQSEALSMSDRVVVMHDGLIQQVGDPWSLYNRPANGFVATFVGDANVLDGTVTGVEQDLFTVSLPTLGDGTVLEVALAAGAPRPSHGQQISVAFRPEWVDVIDDDPTRPLGRNQIRTTLLTSEFLGSRFERRYRAGNVDLRVQTVSGPTSPPASIGTEQMLSLSPDHLTWFPAEQTKPGEEDDSEAGDPILTTAGTPA